MAHNFALFHLHHHRTERGIGHVLMRLGEFIDISAAKMDSRRAEISGLHSAASPFSFDRALMSACD
jgi:hypothetical protein